MSVNKTRIGNAAKWSTITEISTKLISPIINMILARLLTPEAFGAVATITMVISFVQIFADAGFQKYLIQHEFESENDLNDSTNVAFWTNICISVVLWLVIALLRNQIAALAGNAELGNGVVIACAAMIAVSFSSIQMARFKRDFDFKALFYARIIVAFIPLIITVPLALLFRNYWALVIGTLCSQIVQAVILTVRSKWKPRISYSWPKFREMFSFSMWTLLETISIWLTSYIGTFIVGNILNDYYLGLYKISISTVNAYMNIVIAATTPVLFSALSRQQNNKEEFKKIYFKFQRLVSLLVLPMGAGLFMYRELATQILLGSQWSEAANFIGLWALMSGITIVFGHYNSEVYRSLGKPRLSLLLQVLHLIVLIPILYFSAKIGFTQLYIWSSLIRIHLILTGLIIQQVCCHIYISDVIKNVLPIIFATIVIFIVAFLLQQVSSARWWQFCSIFIYIVSYFAIAWCIPSMRQSMLEINLVKKIAKKLHLIKI